MSARGRGLWVGLIVVALAVGVIGGYFGQAGQVAALQREAATAQESKAMLEAELASAQESKAMLQAELDQAKADLATAIESKAMLEEELKVATVPIAFASESGQMIHDAWLLIAPVGQGKFAVVIRAEGLDATAPDDVYLLEGVTRSDMQTLPLGPTLEASEFVADDAGGALYWVILDQDPRTTFEKIVLLLLPGMSMEQAVLLATASFG
jgi:hypothetical protein